MATTIYLTNSAPSHITNPDFTANEKLEARVGVRGSGLSTGITDTVAGTTTQLTRDTASDVEIDWYTPPLNAVTIGATSMTFNAWMSESNMSANVGAWYKIDQVDNEGSLIDTIYTNGKGTELPTTTRAAQNWTGTATSRVLAAGDRIRIRVYGADLTEAAGFTFNCGFAGITAAADGDSWVQFTETITELVTSLNMDLFERQTPRRRTIQRM